MVTDCDAVEEILSTHHFTRTIAEAAAISMKAGVDNECVDSYAKVIGNSDYVKYRDAVKLGLVSEQDVDTSVKRLFTARFRLGLRFFGHGSIPAKVCYSRIGGGDAPFRSRLTDRTKSPLAAAGEILNEWRRERDSNPRCPLRQSGFQDRLFQPLTHPSAWPG